MAQKVKPGLQKLRAGLKTGGTGGAAPAPAPAAAVGNTGGYYSPRQYGAQKDSYAARAEAARAAMEERSKALREYQRTLEESRAEVERKKKRYYDLREQLSGDGAAELLAGIEQEWTDAVGAYGQQKTAYDNAYAEYSPYEEAYNRAAQEYSDYIRSEEEAYGQWKSTIRGAGDIRAEQQELKQKRQELVRLMQQSNDIAAGTAAPGIQAQAAQTEARIRELQEYLGGRGEREKLLEEELGWSEHFRFEDLRANPDFAQQSQYRSTGTAGQLQVDPLTGRTYDGGSYDRTYEYVNRNAQAVGAQAMNDINNEMGHLQTMTDDEIALYNYLYATQGPEGAAEYLGHLRQELTARQQEGYNALLDETVRAGGVPGAVLASAGSLLLSPFAGMQTAFGQVGSALTGQEIDPNAGYAMVTNTKNALRQSVSQQVEAHAGPVGSFAYQTVMSMGDMLMDATVGGPGAMALIGTRAFSESVMDGKSRGLSNGEALTLGAVSGLAEVLTERIGLDELLHLPDGWEDAGFWRGLLRGAGGEAAEEGLTNIINLAADLAYAGEDSEFMRTVRANMEQQILPDGSIKPGMTEEEATKAAVIDALKSFGLDVLGGGISGGVFGGVDGWRGKKASTAQKKTSEETKAPEAPKGEELPTVESAGGQMPPQPQSAGEPVETASVAGSSGDSSAVETVSAQTADESMQKRTELPEAEPVNENGGNSNGEEAGERVLPGGSERDDAAGAGEPVGGYAEHRERQQTEARSQAEAAAQRRVKAENLEKRGHLKRVSSQDLGLRQGTEVQELLELPRIEWDQELYDTAARLEKETGMQVRTVTGNIGVRLKGGGVGLAKGYIDRGNKTIVLNVCHSQVTAGQIADHELWHHKMDTVGRISGDRYEVTRLAAQRIQEQYSPEDFDEVLDAYIDGYGDVYDQSNWEEFLNRVYEEIMADAYAGMNAFGVEASKFRSTVDDTMDELGMGRNMWNAAEQEDAPAPGGDQRVYADEDAPPMPEYEDYSKVPEYDWDGFDENEVDFSYGGENARNADREALERAQRMEEQGTDRRQIFRDTGWFRGADGKWRFEIDDSKMKYHRAGDAQFAKDHAEYARLQELTGKMLEATITEEEFAELQELQEVWGRERARLNKRVEDGIADLENLIDHEELFEQYPFLRNTRVRFEDLGSKSAKYSQVNNLIVMDESLRSAPEDILVHEIQHAIQMREGFARGSNPSEWREAAQIAEENYQAERNALKLLYEWTGYNAFMAEQFERLRRGEITSQERTEAGERFLEQSGKMNLVQTYRRRLSEAYEKMQRLNKQLEGRTGFELYESTAGEVEARDVTARRELDANARRETMPDTGDENTVFAESLGRSGDVRFSMDSEGRELSAAQREFFKDSKVRDEAGRLMVLYHGTDAEFTAFDPERVGENTGNGGFYGRGFYFTTSREDATNYGKNVKEYYLNAKKPLRLDGNEWIYELGLADKKAAVEVSETSVERLPNGFINIYYTTADTPGVWQSFDRVSPLQLGTDSTGKTFVSKKLNAAPNILPRDLRNLDELAQSRGFDAIIGEGTNIGDLGTEVVVFRPEQIKSVDNQNPTDDPDIRFSLDKPVEETKTLIAMHNLTEEKLEKAIDLGGFPMPSIAVTRADIPHTNFGEITLVMDKGTVDPRADRRNDVFSADAWTPTFPRTEYEANSEVEDRVRRTLQELERKIAPQFQGNLRRVMYGLEDLLNSYDGEENLIAHVLDNDGMKAVYLESLGKHIDEVQVEQEVPKRYNPAAKEKYEAIIAALGTRDPAEIGTMPLKDIRDNFGAELEKVVPGISKTSLRLSRFMQQTIDYLMDDGSGPETEMVVDQNATRQAMEEALDRDGYEAWVRELFSGIEGNKGIYNGKERFTPSGRSRSFQQTHLPVTLDNIVKAMAAQNGGNTKNVSGFNGVKTLRAGTAQRFKSIQGMHDLEGRLQNLTEEEQTALTDGLQHRLYDLIDEIDQEAGRKGTSNNLIRFDQIGQIITEASETGRYNVAEIQRVFQENHQTISDELALKVKELLFDVSQMPVNLFEAKPRRAVRFDEVRAAVVPADASEELKRKLEKQGVPVIEYERDNTDDRLRKVNSIEDVRFSMDGSLSREEYERLAAEVAGDQSKRNEEFVKSKLTPEQYKQYKAFAREDRLDQEAEARVRGIERFEEAQAREKLNALRAQQAEDAAAGRRELAAEEKSARDEAREKAGTAREERKRKAQEKREKLRQEAKERIRRAAENAPADSAPTIARKDLQDKLIGLFSVGEGQRGELRREIGQLADRMIAEGTVDERDLRRLIDRLYESGVMVIEPEEVYAEGRSYLKDEHIYISPEQIRELGDDWLDLRKKAWGLGVYLTTDRSYAGLDVWNADMASYLPGLFNENETDSRTILERLLDIAQEGKAEKVSLPEYTKRIAKAEHQSEEAMLYNMERQVEEALRTFGEKASLEMRLKNRNARRRAMDREEAAIAREADRAELERKRRELADDREALRELNEAERDRLRLERAENDRRNAAERRRLAEERAARRRKHQENVRKKELRELQEKTLKALQWISKNRRKAPEAMQEAFTAVLGNIDLYAISMADEMNWSSKYGATWKDLKQMYNHARTADPNFIPSEDLQRIVDRLDSVQLESMDFDQLRDLYQAAVGLRTEFYNRNNVIGSEEHEIMEELYNACVEEIRTAPKKLKGMLDRFLNLEQLTPMNVFEEMGGFNPDGALYKFAKQLEDGERKVRSFKVRSNKILADFLEDNSDWIHKADGQGKDGIWIEVEIPQLIGMKVGEVPEFGGTVKVAMTPMQRVHLYLESRNYDNLRHMTGGRTFADRELYSQGKREEAFAKGTTIRMAPETVQLLVNDMSPEELELAKLLDKYYNDLAATEINKVSNILLGYNKAMGGHYAPIFTNANYTKSEFGKFDGTAEGAGNLKERVKSKNPSYNISALEAFERNMDRTAIYVGMAIPVRNWNTLMNWRTNNSSFADEITHSWGKGRLDYIQDLITDLQNPMGEQQDMVTEMSGKLLSNYISSVFGFNPSIVVKQLGSIPMASAYLDWKHFPKGVIGKGKIDRELIGRYTQELDWRTMGYSMPETKQLKDAPNWSQKNKAVGLVFGGDAITAMDGWAASVLWPWAENKVRAEFPGLEVGDAAMIESGQSPFYQKVAELFNDAVSRSQSVSDQMHQGRLRKSKHAAAKAFTMFRSDSAQSYNVLRQRLGELDYYRRQGEGGKVMAEAAKKAVGAAATAVLINSIWGTTVDLLVRALKGKLDEEDKDPLQIAEDFFWGVIDSYAGMVTAGDIIAEVVGGWFTGEKAYSTEAPGIEQFNDIKEAADKIINAGKKGNLIGAIKIAAETVASYGFGLPSKNVEAYLMGLFSWALPGAKVAYEDLLKAPAKADLKGLEGDALTVRLNHVLKGYGVELEPDVREALAALYEAGYTEAVPSAAPDAVTVDGMELELDGRMKKEYDKTRGGIIEQELTEITGSAFFAQADEKTRKAMVTKLYNYAAEKAKEAVLEDYPIGTTAQAIDEIVRSGGSAADYAVFDAVTADMAAWQRAEVLQEWGTDEAVTGLMFKYLVSKSWEDEQAELRKVGVDVGQFLELYAMHGEIDSRDLKATEKATEFAYWLDGQRYTDQQKDTIKDQMAYFQMMPADASRYNTATAAGLDREQALELTEGIAELGTDPETVAKYRVAIDQSVSESNQLKMLAAAGLKDSSYDKVAKGYEMGVAPAAWVRVKEVQQQFDANGNGRMTQAEWEAAIEGICSYGIVLPGDNTRFNLTNEQKAVLWQMMMDKDTKSKNNPFDPAAGQRWRELMGYE